MGKEKKFRRITDAAAGVITWHDEAQIRFDRWLKEVFDAVVSGAAGLVTAHDTLQLKVDRLLLILQYNAAQKIHEGRKFFIGKKKSILGHFAGVVLVAIAMVALFSHATGYEYAYNGRSLGYVKNQEDVIKILDLVSDELSKEYGSNIQIDKDSDITFQTVFILDKEIDDVDTVLKRLTYMSDMEAEAYGIYIDGRLFVTCESEEAAETVLKNIQKEYLEDDENIEYEQVGFKENVEIRQYNTKLAYISSVKKATEAILSGSQKEIVYTVKSGDTFSEICHDHDITFDELKKMNPGIKEDSLYPGDELVMSKAVSALTVVTVEKGTYAEKVKYKTEYREDSSMYEGDQKVIQKGVNGKQVVTARITRENGEIVEKDVLATETIKKAVKKIVVKGTKPVPKTAPTGHLIMPVSGYTLTSEFGWRWGRMHEGIDLACPTGTTIRAADGGTVTYAGWYSGYGLFIEIDHGGGKKTRYGHCNSIDVSVGEQVYQGQKIGEVGNTGNSYGSHCHFEVTINGSPVNPFNYL
ncbi:MAG: LysM peptidoglycan-binding domain-containing M23 family metallopeptidase [Emergencia sp.]